MMKTQELKQFFPLNEDIIFSNAKKVHSKGIERRQSKLLKGCEFIKPFLRDGEEIILVSRGCSKISLLEQLFMGIYVFYVKRSIFVFTNQRLFHIPSTPSYVYRQSVAVVEYGDIKSLKMKGRWMIAEYGDQSKEKFLMYGSKELKKIKTLAQELPFGSGPKSRSNKRTHLCPRCTHQLEEGKFTCSKCRLAFKDLETMKVKSWIIPGGGYFYTNHPWLGLGDAFAEVMLMFYALIMFLNISEFGPIPFLLVTGILVLEKVVTVHDSQKFIAEYIPLEKNVTTQV